MTKIVSFTPEMDIILKLSGAVTPALAMLAGCQLDVFTPLRVGALDAEQLAEVLGVGVAKLRPLLYVLVSAGLLTVVNGRFANTAEADYYLVKDSPAYMGDRHELWSLIWESELKTAASIRNGIGQAKQYFDYAHTPPEQLEQILRGLHGGAVAHGRMLAQCYDFSTYQTLLDVGGGSGGLATVLVQMLPHLKATIVDLPSVTPITQRFVDEADGSGRIQVMAMDVVQGPLSGLYDAAVLRAFIQPGGAIFIIGWVLEDDRLFPPEAVIANLFFVNAYDGGQAYTEREHREWLTQAGFENYERVILPDAVSILTARKYA